MLGLLLALAGCATPRTATDVPEPEASRPDAVDVAPSDASAGSDTPDTPPGPPGVLSLVVMPHPAMAVAALAHVVVPAGATHLSYAHGLASDHPAADEAPRVPVGSGSAPVTLPLLGLAPGVPNVVRVTAWAGAHPVAVSDELVVTTAALPEDFPVVTVTTDVGSLQGTLLISMVSKDRTRAWAVACDRSGRPLWYHAVPRLDERSSDFQLGPNGSLFVYSLQAGGIEELRLDGERVRLWTDSAASLGLDGHDFHPLPDGRLLVTGRELLPPDAVRWDPDKLSDHAGVVGSTLDLLSPTGDVLHHVSAYPSFTPDDARAHVVIGGYVEFDHLNALAAVSPTDVLASFAFLGSVARLDVASGQVRWILGGDRNQFRFEDDPLGGFSGQHSVQVLADGDVLLFDNGLAREPAFSRAVQYHLDEDARTATLAWEHRRQPDTFVRVGGSVQRLDDGSTLVGWSLPGVVEVIGADGVVRWEASTSLPFYRARHVPSLVPAP